MVSRKRFTSLSEIEAGNLGKSRDEISLLKMNCAIAYI
jgi:hypothetical protein